MVRLYTLCITLLVALLAMLTATGCATSRQSAQHAIATSHPLASQAGLKILDSGGSAMDAAVAAAATLAVVSPQSASLGGSSLWLIRKAHTDKTLIIDGIATAPADLPTGSTVELKGLPGIPGHPAALTLLTENFAQLPTTTLYKDAVRLAYHGFQPDPTLRRWLGLPSNQAWTQPTLARTLADLAKEGHASFYQGERGAALHQLLGEAYPVLTDERLISDYTAVPRAGLSFVSARGHAVYAPPPPASPGAVLHVLAGLQRHLPYDQFSPEKRATLQAMHIQSGLAIQKTALGDPAFDRLPTAQWLTEGAQQARAKELLREDNPFYAEFPTRDAPQASGSRVSNATAFVLTRDRFGNQVAGIITTHHPLDTSIADYRYCEAAGVYLNAAMNDFNTSGTDVGALTSAFYNAPTAGKRPVVRFSPVLIEGEGAETLAVINEPQDHLITLHRSLNAGASNEEASPKLPSLGYRLQPGRFITTRPGGGAGQLNTQSPFSDPHQLTAEGKLIVRE